MNLNDHLDSKEMMLYFFRPSRLAYIHQYIFFYIVFFAIIYLGIYLGVHFSQYMVLTYLSIGLLLYPIIMLVRLEYRIFSRRYGITNERVIYSRGVFTEVFKSVRYVAITDVSFSQTLWDKITNTGSLSIDTAGTDGYEIRYRKIRDPLKVMKMINDQIPDKDKVPDKNQPLKR